MIINNQPIKVKRYSSGEMKLLFDDYLPLAQNGKMNIIYNNEESVFELFLILKFLKDNGIEIELTLSYLPYQRMDHKNNYEVNTLKYVAEMINSLNLDKVNICEPHCELELFNNAKKVSFVEPIYKKLKKEIGFDEERDYLIFTDKGSERRYGHLGKNHIYFEKKRDKVTGLIASHKMIGEMKPNRKAILVDDIISSGDTIINCLNMLDKNQKVSIVAGHFEENKYNKRILELDKVERVYSSDSLTKKEEGKLKLFKVENLIEKGENKMIYQNITNKEIEEIKDQILISINDAHAKGVVLGMSGGKDSLITAKLCVDALGAENVLGIILPNGYMKDNSVAEECCKAVGIRYMTLDISEAVNSIIKNAEFVCLAENVKLNTVTTFNVPPRVRMTTLYAIAGSLNYLVANTSNLSEATVGYTTKWGDNVGDFFPLLNYTKSEVCEIGLKLGLPKHLVLKTPDDGLSGKSDEEKLGVTYDDIDRFIRTGEADQKDKIIELYKKSVHKRRGAVGFVNNRKNYAEEVVNGLV